MPLGPSELRALAQSKRRMAETARRARGMLTLDIDCAMMLQHAEELEAEAAGLEAQAESLERSNQTDLRLFPSEAVRLISTDPGMRPDQPAKAEHQQAIVDQAPTRADGECPQPYSVILGHPQPRRDD
jgi:hypothetical protein